MAKEIMDVPEFAAMVGVSPDAIYDWVKSGMPSLRPTKRTLRIPVSDAVAWMRQRAENSLNEHISRRPDEISNKTAARLIELVRERVSA